MSSTPSRTRKTIILMCIVVYAATVLVVGAARAREDQSSTSDFDDFWMTGRHFLDSGEVRVDYGVHNYLPFFVLFISPFAALPIKAACVVFNAIGLSGFVLSVYLVDRRLAADATGVYLWHRRPAGGPSCSGEARDGEARDDRAPPQPGRFLRLAGPIGMVLPYVTGCLVMGQMALYTLAMLVLCWHYVEKRRDLAAGFWLALAVSTKVYPLVLIAFFVLKRKWRLVGTVVVALAFLNVALPCLAFGSTVAWRLHAGFWERSVRGQSSMQLAVIDSNKMSYANQSSALVARRYTHPTDSGVDGPDGRPRYINLTDWDSTAVGPDLLSFARVQWVLLTCYAVTVAAAAWTCRHRARLLTMQRMRYEYAAWILLALLLSPIVWSFYYCLCYLPLALLNWQVLARLAGRDEGSAGVSPGRRPWLRGVGGWSTVAVALWWLAIPAVALPSARMCGFHLGAMCVLYITMLVLAARLGRAKIDVDESGHLIPAANP